MNVFDLQAKIGLDTSAYDRGISKAGSALKGLGSTISIGFASMAKIGAKTLATIGTASAAGITMITKAAVKSYSEYEQLVGGVETLFGLQGKSLNQFAKEMNLSIDSYGDLAKAQKEYNKALEAQNIVMANASNAWKTTGLSANQYMNTITSFAASLKQSTSSNKEAAEVADMAMVDMADNANKMGTSMDSIMAAYMGFSKQNYTMLDNLKLGYGGTKTEMERLLKDASKLAGKKYDISNLSDVYEAIHVIQTELGVTGTTAEEAEKTISGSMSAMKAAWENLITGLADPNADLGKLFDNVVSSAETAFKNLLPAVKRSLTSVVKLVGKLVPTIVKELPGLLKDVIPVFLDSVKSLSRALIDAMPDLLKLIGELIKELGKAFMELAPELLEVGISAVLSIMDGLESGLPDAIPKIAEFIKKIIAIFGKNLGNFLSTGVKIVKEIATGITENAPSIIKSLVDYLVNPQTIGLILEAIKTIVKSIVDLLTNNGGEVVRSIIRAGVTLLEYLVSNIGEIIDFILDAIGQIIDGIVTAFTEEHTLTRLASAGFTLLINLLHKLPDIILHLLGNTDKILMAIINEITSSEFLEMMAEAGVKLIEALFRDGPRIAISLVVGLWNAIASLVEGIVSKLGGKINLHIDAGKVTKFLGLESTSDPDGTTHHSGSFKTAHKVTGVANIYSSTTPIKKRKKLTSTPGGYVSAFASGTAYARRGWSLVGENGPELMFMNGGERVVPANETHGVLSQMSENGEQQIIGLLQAILEKTGASIVLDDGTLVGHVDQRLGALAARKARGN